MPGVPDSADTTTARESSGVPAPASTVQAGGRRFEPGWFHRYRNTVDGW
jgi:hypothetical protein